eukprot:20635-Heterococcus_DN1.PRE.5
MMQAVLKRVPVLRVLKSQSVGRGIGRGIDRSVGQRHVSALVDEAHDTYELMDSLLARLDNDKPAFIFLDVDETLVTRDTCLVHGFQHTTHLLLDLEQRLASRHKATAAAILARMRSEMERDYYGSDVQLVDPLLTRLVRGLKMQGHFVFGLTSNSHGTQHSKRVVAALAKYEIRFSKPLIRGEMPSTGALVMDHPVIQGILFADDERFKRYSKGDIIADFVKLSELAAAVPPPLVQPTITTATAADSNSTGSITAAQQQQQQQQQLQQRQRQLCVLVDNTAHKCQLAAESFERLHATTHYEFKAIHYTAAEAAIGADVSRAQFLTILKRLKTAGLISAELEQEYTVADSTD